MAGAAKRVDGLKFITDYSHIVMRIGHEADNLCLQFIGVLILVHHYVTILLRELMAQLWASFESFAQSHKQIVISQHMTAALKFFKRCIELFERFAFVDELR